MKILKKKAIRTKQAIMRTKALLNAFDSAALIILLTSKKTQDDC